MQLELTSPVKGKMPGDTVTVTEAEGRWYLANGYARVDDDGDHRLDSSVEATADPTLAANREEPGTPPATIANDERDEQKAWTDQVVDKFEYKGKAGPVKIVPGDPSTQVAALEKTLAQQVKDEETTRDFDADEQPPPSEVTETKDPLKGKDLTERPEITAEDSAPKSTRKR